MVSLFRLEQKEIEDKFRDEFISLYDLFIKLNGEKFVFNKFEYGLFLIDRFNSLNSEELQYCAFWEPQTPFINCSFKHVDSKELKDEIKYLIKNGKFKRQRASRKIMLRKESFSRWKTYNGGIKNLIKPETTDTEKDSIIAQLQSENAELQTRISELEQQLQQSTVDSKTVLELQNQLAGKEKVIEELREQLRQKPNNTASDNKKNAFIKSLLFIHYGEQVAENPRPYIYDPNSSEKSKDGVIQKSFELSGLDKHLPSGRTLQNWIKSVEL